SGVVAMLRTRMPALTPRQIKEVLTARATRGVLGQVPPNTPHWLLYAGAECSRYSETNQIVVSRSVDDPACPAQPGSIDVTFWLPEATEPGKLQLYVTGPSGARHPAIPEKLRLNNHVTLATLVGLQLPAGTETTDGTWTLTLATSTSKPVPVAIQAWKITFHG
ncbi:MAG TPA: hypothetical protein VGH11_18725, partial [Jatrophihabitans sp.]